MSADAGALAEEHLLLGAVMAEHAGSLAPLAYGPGDPPEAEVRALREACGVSDLSFAHLALVSGDAAQALFEAAWAGRRLDVGECAFGAVLAGDGSLVSAPLAVRTGDREFLLVDASPRWEALLGWLGWLQGLESGDVAPFADSSVTDETGSLVPLAVIGPRAHDVLSDYLHGTESLPPRGRAASVHLDRILAICAHVPLDEVSSGEGEALLAFVPPAYARIMWRSLMSFSAVSPVGVRALFTLADGHFAWRRLLEGRDRLAVSRDELMAWGLVRDGSDYVGARALASREG